MNGQTWSSPGPRGQWKTEKNGGNRLCSSHLRCPTTPAVKGYVKATTELKAELEYITCCPRDRLRNRPETLCPTLQQCLPHVHKRYPIRYHTPSLFNFKVHFHGRPTPRLVCEACCFVSHQASHFDSDCCVGGHAYARFAYSLVLWNHPPPPLH